MMQINSQHLLKFFPLDEKVRSKILVNFEKFSDDQRLELNKLCWTIFYEMVDAEVKYEFQKMLVDISENNRKLTKNIYKNISNQIFKKYMRNLQDELEEDKLEELRDSLKLLITDKTSNKIESLSNKN